MKWDCGASLGTKFQWSSIRLFFFIVQEKRHRQPTGVSFPKCQRPDRLLGHRQISSLQMADRVILWGEIDSFRLHVCTSIRLRSPFAQAGHMKAAGMSGGVRALAARLVARTHCSLLRFVFDSFNSHSSRTLRVLASLSHTWHSRSVLPLFAC